jgi:hypothetical protein
VGTKTVTSWRGSRLKKHSWLFQINWAGRIRPFITMPIEPVIARAPKKRSSASQRRRMPLANRPLFKNMIRSTWSLSTLITAGPGTRSSSSRARRRTCTRRLAGQLKTTQTSARRSSWLKRMGWERFISTKLHRLIRVGKQRKMLW